MDGWLAEKNRIVVLVMTGFILFTPSSTVEMLDYFQAIAFTA